MKFIGSILSYGLISALRKILDLSKKSHLSCHNRNPWLFIISRFKSVRRPKMPCLKQRPEPAMFLQASLNLFPSLLQKDMGLTYTFENAQ